MEDEEDVIDYWVAKSEYYKEKRMEEKGDLEKDFWDNLDIDGESKYLNLIDKIKEFRKVLSKLYKEQPENDDSSGFCPATCYQIIREFDNHFKEELK